MTVILWVNLSQTALYGGLAWAGIGLVYLLILTRGGTRAVQGFDESNPVTGFNKTISE
jgi:putrescine importer